MSHYVQSRALVVWISACEGLSFDVAARGCGQILVGWLPLASKLHARVYTYTRVGRALSSCVCPCVKSIWRKTHLIFVGAWPKNEKMGGKKWKIYFYETKGDVGMSLHEKENKQEYAYTETQNHS